VHAWTELLVALFGSKAGQAQVTQRGGQFDTHWQITFTDGRRAFAKTAAACAADRFAAEADGLTALAASGAVRVPAVLAHGLTPDGSYAYLILEWLDLVPLAADRAEAAARAVVALHEAAPTPDRFGWHRDNYLGATPQQNGWEPNWAHFFVERRLRPQLALAKGRGFPAQAAAQLETILTRLPALFLEYAPQPALLHGDLWYGNLAQTTDGAIALFDPAVHQGDHESELAMMELFGGFPTPFYAAYRRLTGLHRDYERRKPLYTLYHVLNHFNLFGGSYARQACRLIAQLAEG